MSLPHFERQTFVEGVADQESVDEPCIDSSDTDDTAAPWAGDALAERRTGAWLSFQRGMILSPVLPLASKPTASMLASGPRPFVAFSISFDGVKIDRNDGSMLIERLMSIWTDEQNVSLKFMQ